jgi:CNT family concentrative nucleoside transporter
MSVLTYFLEYNRYLNIIGIVVLFAIAVLFSKNRRAINAILVLKALVLQFVFALLMIKTTWGIVIVGKIAEAAGTLSLFAQKGIDFMFGNLGNAELPWGFVFAIKVLPIIIFVGALTSLLFHWGIVQKIVSGLNIIIRPLLGTSGVETVSAIANSILGQTEASLFMSNYVPLMTRSELFVLMVSGMASISISVLVIYVMLGIPGSYLLTASIMSIPSAIAIAKIMVPETESSTAAKDVTFQVHTKNGFDAIAKGTMDGLNLAVAVAAMLISFLAFIALGDYLLAFINLSFAQIFSYIFAPFAFLLGFTGQELWHASTLMGIKTTVNELVAFSELVKISLSPRTFTILVYALCGFSNFSCIGIQIGMIGILAPEKREYVTQMGLYTVLASALANLLSACIVSLLI